LLDWSLDGGLRRDGCADLSDLIECGVKLLPLVRVSSQK
jgi:hypothetical protein